MIVLSFYRIGLNYLKKLLPEVFLEELFWTTSTI